MGRRGTPDHRGAAYRRRQFNRRTGSVDAEAAGIFRISFADNADPTDALVRRAVEESWGLFQLVPAQTSVEEVFVQLTKKDEAAA